MTAFYITLTLLSWASAFVAMRIAITDFAPGSLVLLRCLVSAILVSMVVLPRQGIRGFCRLSGRDFGRLLLMAISGAVLYNLLLARGQKTVSALGASLLLNTVPIWTAILAGLLLRERLGRLAWSGVGFGFVGAILVGSSSGAFTFEFAGALAILMTAICQAFYFVLLRSLIGRVGAGRTTAWTFLLATAVALPFAGSLAQDLAVASRAATTAVIYLSIVPGVIGVWSWSQAAKRLPASRQAVFLYLVPPLTAIMAWGILGETPGLLTAAGGAITITGAALVSWKPLRRPIGAG